MEHAKETWDALVCHEVSQQTYLHSLDNLLCAKSLKSITEMKTFGCDHFRETHGMFQVHWKPLGN